MFTDKFICVTNIPSPYRLYQFQLLNQALDQEGIEFEAWFMAKTEVTRQWQYSPDSKYENKVFWGIHPRYRTMTFHINPALLISIFQKQAKYVLLGAGWMTPTTALATLLLAGKKDKTTLLFWVEGNIHYSRSTKRGWVKWLQRKLMSNFDGFVVPGQTSVDYVHAAIPDRNPNFLTLTNFIDVSEYHFKVQQLKENRTELRKKYHLGNEPILFWPARLIPEKGILQFLEILALVPENKYKILIAGDGPLKSEIDRYIRDQSIDNVMLLGHQDNNHMLELYALSDVLMLPSLREPYGFVTIEALWAGLPLIISKYVGSISEVLEEGVNGWMIDPLNRLEVVEFLEKINSISLEKLNKMGKNSIEIAKNRFDPTFTVEKFVCELLAIFPR